MRSPAPLEPGGATRTALTTGAPMESIVATTLMGMPASDGARSGACLGSGQSLAPSYRAWPLATGINLAEAIKPATAMFVDVQTDHRTRRLWGTS